MGLYVDDLEWVGWNQTNWRQERDKGRENKLGGCHMLMWRWESRAELPPPPLYLLFLPPGALFSQGSACPCSNITIQRSLPQPPTTLCPHRLSFFSLVLIIIWYIKYLLLILYSFSVCPTRLSSLRARTWSLEYPWCLERYPARGGHLIRYLQNKWVKAAFLCTQIWSEIYLNHLIYLI